MTLTLSPTNYKNSISIIETLFSLIVLSIILITVSNLNLTLFKQHKQENELLLNKLDFEASRLFLEKKMAIDKHLNNLIFKNNTLFYKNDIFLHNVIMFTKVINNNMVNIELCIKRSFEQCQIIKINNDI